MRRLLAALLLCLAWTWAANAQGFILSSESDGLFNANAETSRAIDWQSKYGSTFTVQVLATGSPTTCTWNLLCSSKGANVAVDAEYNSLGESPIGTPADLSCLVANKERATVFVNKPFAACKVRLVTIGGGTSPAVVFYVTPGGTK